MSNSSAAPKAVVTIQELFEAGVHFGHSTRRWNPKMAPFIYGERNKTHIMDLRQSVVQIQQAAQAITSVVAKGGRVLFVGTKPQASQKIAEAAERCGQYYVNHRWLGGMLTNFDTVSNSIKTLRKVEKNLEEGDFTKKEKIELNRKREKLERSLGGIREMGGLPHIIVVMDTNRDHIAVEEANKLGIPVVAILDSNSAPEGITYPIAGNDDAHKAIELYTHLFSKAVLEGLSSEISKEEFTAQETSA